MMKRLALLYRYDHAAIAEQCSWTACAEEVSGRKLLAYIEPSEATSSLGRHSIFTGCLYVRLCKMSRLVRALGLRET